MKRYKEAIPDFNIAIQHNIFKSASFNNLGIIYENLQDYNLAIANYNKAIEYDPKNSDSYTNRCVVYAKLGNLNRALNDCRKSLKINPNDQGARKNVAILKQAINQMNSRPIQSVPNQQPQPAWQKLGYSDEFVCRRAMRSLGRNESACW